MAQRDTPPDDALSGLLEHVQRARGFDLTGYKRTTLERRIQKRMATVGIADYASYLALLRTRAEEFEQLFTTILINVTSFFRDPEVWETVREQALPQLLEHKDEALPIRMWSVGCSSGQEAYTLAMLVAEHIGLEATTRRLKVYATDVDEDALRQARRASYADSEVEGLPDGFREKYFEAAASRFDVRKELRHCIIFGRHDLIHDAPISRIDLLTCRNTIMYLNAGTQERILPRLHYALAPNGVLVLGKAEMLLSHPELFTPLDLKRRVFVKTSIDAPPERIPIRVTPRVEQPQDGGLLRLRQQAFDAGPVAQLVVEASGVVVQISRRAREVFGLTEQDQGRPLQDLEISYRPVELRSLIEQAYAEKNVVVVKDVERPRPGIVLHYEVQVTPLVDRETSARLGAEISFIDISEAVQLQQQLRRTNAELQAAFEQLQSTSEELETTNEELQSTNEELETTNEELQSTNEELETMNEELQSTNETQQSLNDEVRHRSDELTSANLSLEAILATLRSAVVVVDRDLHVKKWSARAEDLWGVRAGEAIGKSLLSLDIGLPVEKLVPGIRACFEGDDVGDVTLDATNRRGHAIACKVACIRLASEGEDVRDVVLVIGEASG